MARASKASSAAKKKATPKKAAGKTSAAKKAASAKKASAKKAAPAKKASAKKAAPATKASAKKAVAKKAAPAEKASAKKASAKKAVAKKAAPAKKASAEKPSAKKATPAKKAGRKATSPFPSRFLDRQRKLLLVERDTYERQAAQLRAEAASMVDSMEPGDVNFDEEGGEGDTIAVERNRDLALAAKAQEMIEEIDRALAKFDEGTYGICEVSGEPIPEERLEAIPWAREKVEFKAGGFGRR